MQVFKSSNKKWWRLQHSMIAWLCREDGWELGEEDNSNEVKSLFCLPLFIEFWLLEPGKCFTYTNKKSDYSKQQQGDKT